METEAASDPTVPAGTETPQNQPAAEADADLAPPAVAFQVEYWLSLAAAMEADASHRLLDGLAPLMAAMGRTKEAPRVDGARTTCFGFRHSLGLSAARYLPRCSARL